VPEAAGRMEYPWFSKFQSKPELSPTGSKNRHFSEDWTLAMRPAGCAAPDGLAHYVSDDCWSGEHHHV
jgi:hypothetical protein